MRDGDVSDEELLAWLDEQLPAETMAEIEQALRKSKSLQLRLSQLISRRDQGAHTVGGIWRRQRLSCPSRSELGSYLLQTLDEPFMQYVDFHLQTVGCRYCAANLEDLEQSIKPSPKVEQRRKKIFQSSAGFLRKDS